jgi:hypothetical protein
MRPSHRREEEPDCSLPLFCGVTHSPSVGSNDYIAIFNVGKIKLMHYIIKKAVCRVQLLLVLGSEVILGSESHGIHGRILLRFETLSTWRARYPYLNLLGTGWPSYTPRYGIPFSSPPTTRRATVDVFQPGSIWAPIIRIYIYKR